MKEATLLPITIIAMVIAIPVSLALVYSIVGLILSFFGINLPR